MHELPDDEHKAGPLMQSPKDELLMGLTPHLTSVIANGHPKYNLPTCLIGMYDQDAFFSEIVCHLSHHEQFEIADGLLFLSNSDH